MTRILVYSPESPQRWIAAFESALSQSMPDAQLYGWPGAPPCDYAALWNPPAELFAEQGALKAVFSLGAGVDSLVGARGLPADVPLVRVEGAGMARQMAEYALYAALHHLRRFNTYADLQRAHQWKPHSLRDRSQCRVGVLGLGVLGRYVAQTLADFGFSVTGWSRSPARVKGVECRHGGAGLEGLLSQSEVLVVLLPLTAATRGLLDARLLSQLPEGATLVNLARGPIVVEGDLLAVLESGRLGSAILDVFDTEPLPHDHPFWGHPRVTVTPHVAAQPALEAAASQIVRKIADLERGKAIGGVVNRERGY